MTWAVPIVDISPYVAGGTPEDRARVAREIDAACASVGFIQIVGHGVQQASIAGLAAAMDAFFGLPFEARKATG